MLKKKLAISLITFGSLLALSVGTTLAYFAAMTGAVVNTFTVGEIKIELTETTGADYALVPGKSLKKDPVITVKNGSEACWLFVELRFANDCEAYVGYQLAEGWTALDGNDGVYYLSAAKTETDAQYTVFKDNQVTIKDTLTKEQLASLTQAPKLTVYAYAVQSENVATVEEAWGLMQAEL